jgi:ATP diphosphatase
MKHEKPKSKNSSNKDVSILAEFTLRNDSAGHVNDKSGETMSQLQRSDFIQRRCSQFGFDWPDEAPVIDKIKEELAEVQEAQNNPAKGQQDIEEELGDLLFACVNLCRHLNVNPEKAITLANEKFIKRFQYIESELWEQGLQLENQNLSALEALWVKAKKKT